MKAFVTILRQRADALVTEGSPIIYVQRGRIVGFAAEHRLPLATNRESTEEGGLMSYGVKAPGLFSNLAVYVDRLLKGASPSDLPIQRPTSWSSMPKLPKRSASPCRQRCSQPPTRSSNSMQFVAAHEPAPEGGITTARC